MSSPAAATAAVSHYTQRAPTYDTDGGGWHRRLAQDFVDAVAPAQGAQCLDLACGTGLVTRALANAAGRDGHVIGVDITAAMLDMAQGSAAISTNNNSASVEYLEHDIASPSLTNLPPIRNTLDQQGGFDVITCCSALVLLDDPSDAIKLWAEMLRPGSGKLIVDIPTEDRTLQYIFTQDLRVAMGLSNHFDRAWIEGMHSLGRLCRDAGLLVERLWRTGNQYGDEGTPYGLFDGERVFEEQWPRYQELVESGRKAEAKAAFLEVWYRECSQHGGILRDGHWLYIVIARRDRMDA
jgi:ubiquinone/menaquinone biosynthesis C-methylase UbiE